MRFLPAAGSAGTFPLFWPASAAANAGAVTVLAAAERLLSLLQLNSSTLQHAAIDTPGPLTLMIYTAYQFRHTTTSSPYLLACFLPHASLCSICCACDDIVADSDVKSHLLAGTTSTLYVVSGFRLDTITLRDLTLCGDGSLLAPAAGRTSTAGAENHTMKRWFHLCKLNSSRHTRVGRVTLHHQWHTSSQVAPGFATAVTAEPSS
jgi:hypothetical protein